MRVRRALGNHTTTVAQREGEGRGLLHRRLLLMAERGDRERKQAHKEVHPETGRLRLRHGRQNQGHTA